MEELLLQLVWQTQEHGELTPQILSILNLYRSNDRCSVNTKLGENGEINANGCIIHKAAQCVAYITFRIVLKVHSTSSK